MDVDTFHRLLDQLKGTPVVVNIWGSWCAPCKAEVPFFVTAAEAHPNIQFVGVDVLDSRDGATAFIEALKMPYPSVFDPPAAIRADLASVGQPETFFFNAQGSIVAKWPGQITPEALATDIARISE